MKHISEAEAMKAAEDLLKMFDKIDRECFEREQDQIVSLDINTGKIIK